MPNNADGDRSSFQSLIGLDTLLTDQPSIDSWFVCRGPGASFGDIRGGSLPTSKAVKRSGIGQGREAGILDSLHGGKEQVERVGRVRKRVDQSVAMPWRRLHQKVEQKKRLPQGGSKNVWLQMSIPGEVDRKTRGMYSWADQGMPWGHKGTSLRGRKGATENVQDGIGARTLAKFRELNLITNN